MIVKVESPEQFCLLFFKMVRLQLMFISLGFYNVNFIQSFHYNFVTVKAIQQKKIEICKKRITPLSISNYQMEDQNLLKFITLKMDISLKPLQ